MLSFYVIVVTLVNSVDMDIFRIFLGVAVQRNDV